MAPGFNREIRAGSQTHKNVAEVIETDEMI